MPLQIPVTQTGLEASIQQAMRNAGRNAQINLGTNSRQINALAQPLGRITGQADEFTKSMEAANARVFAFGASVGIINGVSKAFSSLVKNTIEVEKSLVEINTVLNASGDSLQKFGNKLFDVAKSTGQTFDIVAKGALELARQGLSTEETLRRINDALILSRLSGLDAQQSVEGLTAAFNSFKETGITTSQILNKLVVVSQKYSVSERDLIEGLKRSASVADQAGVSFDELVGIITTVQERTARGGAVIGNAFKTIFARIQDTGALQDLSNLGVQVTDLQGRVLPATKILQNLAGEFNNLSQLEQADIAKKLGGVYQLSNLLAAVKDLSSEQSKYNDIVKLSAGATNEAYQKNAALNETLAALINKVSVSAQQLGATLGAIGITDNLKSLLDFFNKILEGIQGILGEESMLGDMFRGLAKGIGNVLAGPGLALFGAIIAKLSKDLISFGLESLKSFFKIGQSAKEIANVEKAIAAALGSNLTLQRQLFALEGNRAAQIKLMTDAIVQQEAVMRRMASTAGSLSGALYQKGVRSTGGQGLRIPQAAGGYMPAVSQESRDISRGVGGAKSGDKPVVIPNFAFGGGKRGSMVAHTGEFIVPNFAAGGSAIFNRDMVRSMGLPAGAQKINAAGGFIPNFANIDIARETSRRNLNSIIANKSGIKTPQEVAAAKKRLAELEAKESSVINAQSIIGPLPAVLAPLGEASIGKMKLRRNYGKDKIDFAFSGYTTSQSGIDKLQTQFERRFSDDAIKTFAKERALLAAQQVAAAVGSQPVAPKTIEDISDTDVKGFLSSVRGAMGGIFDAAVSSALRIKAEKGVEGGDFDIRGLNAEQVKKIETLFGKKVLPPSGLADFKIGFGENTTKSMVDKTIKEYGPKINNYIETRDSQVEAINKADIKTASKKAVTGSSGYIPNFANPLKEAINREMSAGIPASQIYVDQNSSLKNSMNPMGLMVANRRDEPGGGMQGINRARKEGVNPMTYGAANGFVPNFQRRVGSGSRPPASLGGGGGGGDSSDIEPVKRDLLGVIFAVQTGLSLLTGATTDATSGLGKLTNGIASVASSVSTVLLVSQGLSGLAKEGSAASKILGRVGVAGAIAVGAFELYKQVGSYFDSTNTSINRARGSMEKVADAASKAAVNLSTLKPSQQERIKQSREGLISDARLLRGRTGSIKEGGEESIAQFEGVSDVLEQSFNQTIDQALAVGISYDKMWNMIKEASKSGGKITADEVNKISQEIEGLIATAAKFKPEDLIKNFGLKPEEGLGQKLINAKPQQVQSFIQGDSKQAKELRDYLSGKGITGKTAVVENLQNVIDLLNEQANAQTSVADAARESISEQVKDTLKLVRAQQLLNAEKLGETAQANQAEIDSKRKVLQISSDLTLSEVERGKKIAEQEKNYAIVTAELQAQSEIADKLRESVSELSKGGVAFGGAKMEAGDLEKAVQLSKEFVKNISGDPQKTKAISDAIKGDSTALAESIKNSETLGSNYKDNAEYIKLMVLAITQFATGQESILNNFDLEKAKQQDLYDIDVKRTAEQERRAAIVEGINYKLESQASALDFRAGVISSKQSVNQARKEVETAVYERTSLATTAEGFKKGLDEINQKYFDLEMAAEREKASLQIKSELTRNLKVDENSLKLVDTTIALNNLKGTVEESIQKLPSILAQAREAGQAVQSPYRLDDLSPISAKATNAISGGLFNDVNDQANNCAKVINRFADSIGLSIKGANDIANSFQNVGDAIDMSNLKPGDILLNTRGKAPGVAGGHVGMYLGGGQVLQASQKAFDQDPITRQQRAAITGFNTGDWNMARRLMPKGQEVAQFTQQGATRQLGLSEKAYSEAVKIASLDISKIGEAADKAAKEFLGADAPAEEISKFASSIRQAAEEVKQLGVGEAAKKEVKRLEDLAAATVIQPQTFAQGWAEAGRVINKDIDDYQYKLGEAIPTSFSNNLAQGIQDAVTGAKSLEDALVSAALSFVQEIQSMAIKNLAQNFTSSLFGFSKGGEVKGYASGGMINGGSGAKDDVPAMLMGGEYVVNKKAVQKYGPDFLHAINNGRLGGYAKGGQVKDLPAQSGVGGFYVPGAYEKGGIQGRQNLLDFATQTATSGQYDVITGGDNYASINLEGESARLTTFGRTRGPQADLIRSAKEEAFGLYQQDIEAEKQRREQQKQLDEQSKAMKTQLLMSIGSMVAGSALNAGASGFKAAFGAAKAGGATGLSAFGSGLKGVFTGASASGGVNVGGLNNWFTGVGKGLTGNFGQAGNYFKLSQMGSLDQLGKSYSMGIGLDGKNSPFTNFLDKSGYIPRAFPVDQKQSGGILNMFDLFANKRATGGVIPSTSGVDTIPTMLSGGEFIMNRAASQNIGAGNLQALNAGAGSLPTEEKTEELNDRLVAKLDELIVTMSESANAGSVTINVDSNGKSTQETSGETSESKQKLAAQIKDTVMRVIEQEKRLGGKLRRGL
jgi:TP901 family phage tail tape measure protein